MLENAVAQFASFGPGKIWVMCPLFKGIKTSGKVWKNAAVQIFLSIGIGTSALATLSSYNDFHNNCQRDAIILPIIDGLTSFLSGLTSFSILGYMAHISGTHIDNVISKGPGIVFIVYPQALSTLPFAQIWAVIFFAMLVLIGLDSQFGHIQVIVTAITDVYPEKFGSNHKTLLTGIVCLVCFLFGIVLITEILWTSSLISFKHLFYGDGTMFPKWTHYVGYGIALLTIIPVPVMGVQQIMKHTGSFVNRLKQSLKPTMEWCPAETRAELNKDDIINSTEEVASHFL
ncbi:sodiumchloride2-likedependent and chloride-dependent glycine transporter 2-like [Octopus vulgaris]|uniref:Sodiumchloride2-likedependent and chloride-dependent glycine transporter 2-like n=1 Tax=Octopus vulgaris TaxID=6645 RepID=A0AA36AZW4_OCTVU|nr:sodiumchloride2-likedependent and chloride-dependent glycine transporter 2-like [Octopus vulgaris]